VGERTLVDYVLSGMSDTWNWPVKHADGYTAGIADLSAWVTGQGNVWIELKSLDAWPVRPATAVVFGLEDLQRLFLWHRRGWLLVRVKREYLLFKTNAIYDHIDRAHSTQALVRKKAFRIWRNSIDWGEFKVCLQRPAR
jgi:hypothetical protein